MRRVGVLLNLTADEASARVMFFAHCMTPIVREVEAVDAGKWKLVPACIELNISRLIRARNDHDQVEA